MVSWPTCTGSGINFWEGQSRCRPRPNRGVLEAWRVAVGRWDAESVLPSWLRHGSPIGILEEVKTAGV